MQKYNCCKVCLCAFCSNTECRRKKQCKNDECSGAVTGCRIAK